MTSESDKDRSPFIPKAKINEGIRDFVAAIYIKILLAADEVEVPMFFLTDNGKTQDTRHHNSLDVIKHLTEDSPS